MTKELPAVVAIGESAEVERDLRLKSSISNRRTSQDKGCLNSPYVVICVKLLWRVKA